MDFTASLSMQGRTGNQLVQTAAGKISMQGRHLTLVGNDLDGALSGFDSSQNFNLVDLGAVFLAGPVGLAVTRGYQVFRPFRGSGRNTSTSRPSFLTGGSSAASLRRRTWPWRHPRTGSPSRGVSISSPSSSPT